MREVHKAPVDREIATASGDGKLADVLGVHADHVNEAAAAAADGHPLCPCVCVCVCLCVCVCACVSVYSV